MAEHAIAVHHDHAHQFDDKEQQAEAVSLGMWAFLVQEILFFGGLFMSYTVYRSYYPNAFIEGSHHLDILLGGFNTVVLIASSLTMAMAVHSAQNSRRAKLVFFLLATLFLGSVFLGVKVVEYSEKFHHHLIPGLNFFLDTPDARQVQIFYCFYFIMTGMHALHMIIGAIVITPLIFMSIRGRFSAQYYAPVEVFGLYWHFVDIVWIFLFPLLYLIGRH
ncbi:MAG: cytochrome c oxidase subunit 3 family protein [Deltaproteobacteria bacterium]|nr:cytochrome c oxidase subunit 3 family protein [Deltaproteobacteria bacterium]